MTLPSFCRVWRWLLLKPVHWINRVPGLIQCGSSQAHIFMSGKVQDLTWEGHGTRICSQGCILEGEPKFVCDWQVA